MSTLSPVGPGIELQHVGLAYNQVTLLDDITCQLAAGQCHGIMGPNGAGKSSLLKTILGLTPYTGSVSIYWSADNVFQKPSIGYMPQLQPFDASMPISVRDYVLMSITKKPLWFRRKLNGEVLSALEKIGLIDKLERKLGDLSGGERQRLMLTTALLNQPTLLLLDEPMSGLDKLGQETIAGVIQDFRDKGGTVLMIEHNRKVLQRCCNQVYWVDKTLQYRGAPDEVFDRLQKDE